MAAKKQHVKLNNPREGEVPWRYKSRNVDPRPEESEEPDYTRMAERFQQNLAAFVVDRSNRIESRTLVLPAHIEYIHIRFQDQFDLNKFSRSYLNDFGLDAVKLTEYNRRVLFAIVDDEKFQRFLAKISAFIEFGRGQREVVIDKRTLYVHDFSFFSSSQIRQFDTLNAVVHFSLLESLYSFNVINQIEDALERYLTGLNVAYTFDRRNNVLEVVNADADLTEDIINNFDIVFSATSSLSSLIRPTLFRLPERSYGFTISNADEDLPLVGIIDTGIDGATPLRPIIVGSRDRTGTDPLIDNENHGTAVAALAAMGKRPYQVGYRGQIRADAKLLSLKVMNTSPAALSDFTVIEIIREAKRDYPQIKLFVLSINYNNPRFDNQIISDYSYQLDLLSHELGILIFISTANNCAAADDNSTYAIEYFDRPITNLCSPAESMNNVTVGACADNLVEGTFHGVAPLKEFPTLYSRRNCQNQQEFFSKRKINKHIRKPDILLPGGDYELSSNFIGTGERATLELLSADPAESFYKNVGTSFAGPLGANLGAQLLKLYPGLSAQSLKALILNASTNDTVTLDDDQHDAILRRLSGYGTPSDEKVLYSDLNAVTFIMEDAIRHKDLIAIRITLPDYLRSITKKRGLLRVTATLCFSFKPEKDNQLAYCPIFMAFSFFRNKTLDQIINDYPNAILRNRWSQDGYAQAKPILYSNVQKMDFCIGRDDIVDENGVIKVAVHCMISPQIKATVSEKKIRITEQHPFSMAITIEENQAKGNLTNRLYSELIAVNEVENIGTIDLENELIIE